MNNPNPSRDLIVYFAYLFGSLAILFLLYGIIAQLLNIEITLTILMTLTIGFIFASTVNLIIFQIMQNE